MTLVAICAHDIPGVQIITFELMSNHVHFILCGSRDDVLAFFALFKKRLTRYFNSVRVRIDLSNFRCDDPRPITTLESLRNQIAYTNRNNFVVDPDHTPFSYPYGANSFYFNPSAKALHDGRYGDMTERAKRVFLHSKKLDYPLSHLVVNGYLSPVSYCRLDIGEALFRDARHYWHKMTKNVESFRSIAQELGDSLYYTDDELSDALYLICKKEYGGMPAKSLSKNDKMRLAQKLHFEYNADNGKIARLLDIRKFILDEIYPLKK